MSTSFIITLLTVILMSISVNGEPRGRGRSGGMRGFATNRAPDVAEFVSDVISGFSTESKPTQQHAVADNDYEEELPLMRVYEKEPELPLLRNLNDGCWTICQHKGGQCDHCGKIGLCCRSK